MFLSPTTRVYHHASLAEECENNISTTPPNNLTLELKYEVKYSTV